MDLSHKIVTARKRKGLTQEQLADLTKVTVRTVQRVESGDTIPRSHTLKAIAAALDISFEELTSATSENTQPAKNTATYSNAADARHFLQMICLSCFCYLVIPLVHFLIPAYLLKKNDEQETAAIHFARKMIRGQIYWKASLSILLLLTLAYNFVRAHWFEKTYILSYFWPFIVMYLLNFIIISSNLIRIKKTNYLLEHS